MKLRGYQHDVESDIYSAWLHARYVLLVLATGAGKTVTFCSLLAAHKGYSCVTAHRKELVSQISLSLARFGIRHRIIAPSNVIRFIVQLHMAEFGRSYYSPNAPCAVASVDTLLARKAELAGFLQQVTLWVMDEAHHVLRENKWGKAVALFPNAKGLGVTACTERTDGKGLGAHTDGVMETVVEGPGMRDLINMGFLTDYRIFGPPSDLDISEVDITRTGEFSPPQLKRQVEKSHIVGDVIEHYIKLAGGKQGITFTSDVDTSGHVAQNFNLAGVPAEAVSAKTKESVRFEIVNRFRQHNLMQLVNVDLFGEGVDVPAICVVSLARPTASFNLYMQQFGRALRILEGKEFAIIIDHVGNVARHGLPDAPRISTLDRREKRSSSALGQIPMKTCTECTAMYEAYHTGCPFCGHINVPEARSKPEFVDGDLTELDTETLKAMRGEIDRIDAPAGLVTSRLSHGGMSALAIAGAAKQHSARQQAQAPLREAIAWWAGHQRARNRSDPESYRRFYFAFGVDVMTAQALGRPAALALTDRINKHIGELEYGS